jgi:surface polysaccharide O-acyltransferase-like enzyme
VESSPETSSAPHSGSRVNAVGPIRLQAFDSLRVFAAMVVFLFHVGHIFDADPRGSIKNAETSMAASVFSALGSRWTMPLFFMIAGTGMYVSMNRQHRTTREFLRERSARLLTPFVFGTLFLVPWNAYLSARNHRTFGGSFWEWLPVHVERTWQDLQLPEHQGLISMYWTSWHLWFFGFLFVFSVVALPLVRWGKTSRGQRLSAWLAAPGRGGLALFAPVFVLLRVGVGVVGAPHQCGATTFGYFLYFLLGWLLMTDARFVEAARRQGPAWVGVGFGCFAILLACIPSGYLARWFLAGTASVDYAIGQGILGLQVYAWTVGVIGCALRWASETRSGPALQYAVQATLPFYILHQVVVFTVGAVVAEIVAPLGAKMLLVTVPSFLLTMGVYELAVRRYDVVRWLLGMRQLSGANAPANSASSLPQSPSVSKMRRISSERSP